MKRLLVGTLCVALFAVIGSACLSSSGGSSGDAYEPSVVLLWNDVVTEAPSPHAVSPPRS
ncbi:MAG: hypothetical protein M5R36_04400 [Deltaproteobacteria bacterium]|nr:hypothetical protein [Deltaproteobacteria bacterium]